MAYQLVEIGKNKLFHLRYLFAQQNNLRKNVSISIIDNFIRLLNKYPNEKCINLYSLNGDISDGTFVMTDQHVAYVDTLDKSHGNLFRLLQLLDYNSKELLFLETRTELQSTILNAIQLANAKIGMVETAQLLYLPKEKALELDVRPPDGITLKPITMESDLVKVNSMWHYRQPGSLQFFKRMAKYNVNVGAFIEDVICFRYPNGFITALQTDKRYQKSGYGSLVHRCISKRIADIGQNVFGAVVEGNRASENMMKNFGFTSVGKVDWIKTKID